MVRKEKYENETSRNKRSWRYHPFPSINHDYFTLLKELDDRLLQISQLESELSEKASEIIYLESKMKKLFGQPNTISDDIGKLLEEE